MDKEKFAIGLGSELNIQIEGMEERFKALLVGMEAPRYLMVRLQIPSTFRNQIDKGTVFIIRYLYFGNVYGFRSKSLGSIQSPFKLTFLSYPDSIESLNIRKAERVSCFIPTAVTLHENELNGLIMDISKGGVRLTIHGKNDLISDVKIDDSVGLSFPLLGLEGTQKFEGIIKSITGDKEKLSFGIEFKDIDDKIKDIIDNYVKDVLGHQ